MKNFQKKFLFKASVIIALITSLFLIYFLSGNERLREKKDQSVSAKEDKIKVRLDGRDFLVEIADTPSKRQKGLMFRKHLCGACGMLFIFEKEEPLNFWMKNTLIPLDIVFISKDKKAVDLATLKPCPDEGNCPIYESKSPAQYVLEVKAGTFTNIKGKAAQF